MTAATGPTGQHGLEIPDETRHRQRRASNPGASAWVSANAGAGKTKVLTDRVIRLLLAGSPPGRILCLTFTKAAAAEMTGRIFSRLGGWVTLPDTELAATLEDLTGTAPGPATVAAARRLFARAVETPGGLKIETIHAFCERVLHLVPFEANVPAGFRVLDDSEAGELLAGARAAVLAEASRDEDGPLAAALATVALAASGEGLIQILDRAAADPRVPGEADGASAALEGLAAALGLAPHETAEAFRRAMLEDGLPVSEWHAAGAELRRTGKPSDADLAADLDMGAGAGHPDLALAAYLRVFFTDGEKPRARIGTQGVDASLRERLAAEQARLVALRERLAAAEALERTAALFVLAGAIRGRRDAAKSAAGALDFDDLIAKTLELLARGGARDWVLYRLDRGIDHVLVDEAQDTNPDQWRILRLLTEEFTAGRGLPGRGSPDRSPRTLFAVGDPKQSIYSFQGADPRWFEDSRRHWRGRIEAAEFLFQDVRLDLSFRSAPAVLAAIDHTFRMPAHFKGLSFEDAAIGTSHTSARPKAPGHVEVWPTQMKEKGEADPDAWALPLDLPERGSPAILAANRVAAEVRRWTMSGDDTGRRLRPRDVLILARKRGPAFFAVIRALKVAGVPVAGADRFDIGEHIAVADLVAAGQAALLPENDLALASALKSPLVGLDEDDLARIARDRDEGESLAAALSRHAEGGDDAARRGQDALESWRREARLTGPGGFFMAVAGPGGGRRRLVERLGHESADAIDAFLCYAASAESGPDAPSLTTFLARFESADHTIKRDLDSAGDEVKVMTVHGAKGLEAPVVVLIDGCDVHGPDAKLLALEIGTGEPLVVWAPSAKTDCAPVARARADTKARALEEHNRLLYVAMTRARDRLVIAPFLGGRGDKEPEEAWCAMVRRSLRAAAEEAGVAVETEGPHGPILVWRESGVAEPSRADERPPDAIDVPGWLYQPVAPEPEPSPPLRPSGVLAAADRPGAGPFQPGWSAQPRGLEPEAARRHGMLVHGLIEHLAGFVEREPGARRVAARAWAAIREPRLPGARHERAIAAALAVLDHPELAPLFGPGSRAEASLVGRLRHPATGAEHAVSGQVDRILVSGAQVLVADFKTGARRPGAPIPASYLGQIALYRALLEQAYPGRAVRALLVWAGDEDGPELVEPNDAALQNALLAALEPAAPAMAIRHGRLTP